MKQSKLVFTGVLIKENSSISALCLEVDVATEGDTIEEAKNNLIDAVTLYIESAVENNLPVLRPVPEDENPLRLNGSKIIESFKLKIDFTVKAYV